MICYIIKQLFKTLIPSALVAAFYVSMALADSPFPRVVVSIKPLQLIASAITDGVSTPQLLLPPGSSPHDYSLRPSDIRKLTQGDLVFWVGDELESFLGDLLAQHVKPNRAIALIEAPGVEVKNFLSAAHTHTQHGHAHKSKDNHAHGGEHHHTHGHRHGSQDPHIWLSPNNAIAMARTMSRELSRVDKAHAKQYQSNFDRFVERVRAADQANKDLLNDVHHRGFFVFHDAWGYFSSHYGLKVVDILTINPEQHPGAKHVYELRQELIQAGSTCLFREPQFQPAYIEKLTSDLKVAVGVLDPLASEVSVGPDSYVEFLKTLASTIRDCLKTANSTEKKS